MLRLMQNRNLNVYVKHMNTSMKEAMRRFFAVSYTHLDVYKRQLIALIVDRGGMVKNLHGQKNVYYQVNATYFSALGESEQKLLLARAIQIFMPGKPQVWYLDLFAGKNDHEAVKEAGEGGHKEINRTNLTDIQIRQGLQTDVVQKQLELLRFRSTSRAFTEDADIQIQSDGRKLMIRWSNSAAAAQLDVDFETGSFVIS